MNTRSAGMNNGLTLQKVYPEINAVSTNIVRISNSEEDNLPAEQIRLQPLEQRATPLIDQSSNGDFKKGENASEQQNQELVPLRKPFEKSASVDSDSQDGKNSQTDMTKSFKIDRVMRSKGIAIKYPFLIIPSKSLIKLAWDSIILVMIAWLIVFLPWQIAYPSDQVRILDYLILACFLFDILVNLRTTHYTEDNEEIIDQKMIAWLYVKSLNFYLDVLSSIPISELYSGSSLNVLRILNLVKIVRLLRLQRLLRLMQDEQVKLIGHLINSLFAFLMLFHWVTCIWLLIVFVSIDKDNLTTQNAWVPSNLRYIYSSSESQTTQFVNDFYLDSDKFPSYMQYIYSYYCLIMVTLGQDIQPVTIGQSYYLITSGIIGSIALAILFGKMAHVLHKSNQAQSHYERTRDEIDNLLLQLPEPIQNKAQEYFEYCWRKHMIFDKNSKDFSELSKSLEGQCLSYKFTEVMRSVPHFTLIDNQELNEIIRRLKTMVFMPGEVVAEYGETIQELFFVSEGLIEEQVDLADSYEPLVLTKNDYYGEDALLGIMKNPSNLVSVGFSTIECLRKQDFATCLQLYPDLRAHVYQSLDIHFKQQIEETAKLLYEFDIFEDFTVEEVMHILETYSETRFIEQGETLLVPNEKINAFYIILRGKIEVLQSENSQQLSEKKLMDFDEHYGVWRDKNKTHFYQEQFFEILSVLGNYQTVGYLNFENDSIIVSQLYCISPQATHLLILTNKHMEQMRHNDNDLYIKLMESFSDLEERYQMIHGKEGSTEFQQFKRTQGQQSQKAVQKCQLLGSELQSCLKLIQQVSQTVVKSGYE